MDGKLVAYRKSLSKAAKGVICDPERRKSRSTGCRVLWGEEAPVVRIEMVPCTCGGYCGSRDSGKSYDGSS